MSHKAPNWETRQEAILGKHSFPHHSASSSFLAQPAHPMLQPRIGREDRHNYIPGWKGKRTRGTLHPGPRPVPHCKKQMAWRINPSIETPWWHWGPRVDCLLCSCHPAALSSILFKSALKKWKSNYVDGFIIILTAISARITPLLGKGWKKKWC